MLQDLDFSEDDEEEDEEEDYDGDDSDDGEESETVYSAYNPVVFNVLDEPHNPCTKTVRVVLPTEKYFKAPTNVKMIPNPDGEDLPPIPDQNLHSHYMFVCFPTLYHYEAFKESWDGMEDTRFDCSADVKSHRHQMRMFEILSLTTSGRAFARALYTDSGLFQREMLSPQEAEPTIVISSTTRSGRSFKHVKPGREQPDSSDESDDDEGEVNLYPVDEPVPYLTDDEMCAPEDEDELVADIRRQLLGPNTLFDYPYGRRHTLDSEASIKKRRKNKRQRQVMQRLSADRRVILETSQQTPDDTIVPRQLVDRVMSRYLRGEDGQFQTKTNVRVIDPSHTNFSAFILAAHNKMARRARAQKVHLYAQCKQQGWFVSDDDFFPESGNTSDWQPMMYPTLKPASHLVKGVYHSSADNTDHPYIVPKSMYETQGGKKLIKEMLEDGASLFPGDFLSLRYYTRASLCIVPRPKGERVFFGRKFINAVCTTRSTTST